MLLSALILPYGSARYRTQCWKYFFRRQAWPFPFYLPGLFSKSPQLFWILVLVVILPPTPTPHPIPESFRTFFSKGVWLTSKYVFPDFFVCFSPIMLIHSALRVRIHALNSVNVSFCIKAFSFLSSGKLPQFTYQISLVYLSPISSLLFATFWEMYNSTFQFVWFLHHWPC